MKQVTIEWEECFKWEGNLATKDLPKLDGNGLYQIYGYHIIFGPDSLLYIGKTDTDFAKRLETHRNEWMKKEADWWIKRQGVKAEEVAFTIRIGRIAEADYKDEPSPTRLLRYVEALQIYWHSPPYNSRHIEEYDGPRL